MKILDGRSGKEHAGMKKEFEVAMGGTIITLLCPENEEDEHDLERLAHEGKLDPRDGFSSDPDVWLKPVQNVGNQMAGKPVKGKRRCNRARARRAAR